VALASWWIGACAPAPPPEPPFEVEDFDVEYSGCSRVLGPAREPSCVLGPGRELTLWVRTPADAATTVTAGDRRWPVAGGEAVAGGRRLRLDGLGAASLRVRVDGGGPEGEWRMTLLEPSEPAYFEEVHRLLDGEASAARRLLEERLDVAADPLERARVLALLAQIERAFGELEAARTHFAAAAATYRRERCPSAEIDVLTQLFSLHLYHRGDRDAAWATLDRLPRPPRGHADSAYLAAYYRGLRAAHLGDPRSALGHFADAAELARRLGLGRERLAVVQMQAQEWSRLGRYREAAAVLGELERRRELFRDDCERGTLLNNVAWNRLLWWEGAGVAEAGADVEAVRERLERAIELYAACGDDRRDAARANAHLNLALVHLHLGDPVRAREELEAASRRPVAEMRPEQGVWTRDVEARIELLEGRPEAALARYRDLEALAVEMASPAARWRALLGQGRAFEAVGERGRALEALGGAEGLLDELTRRVPIDAGRGSAVAVREASTRLYLDLLLRSGEPARAFGVVRRARTRALRGLLLAARVGELGPEERRRWSGLVAEYRRLRGEVEASALRDWELPSPARAAAREERRRRVGELRRLLDRGYALLGGRGPSTFAPPSPRPGELLLAYHPLPSGWAAFAATAEGVEARRIGELDGALLERPERLAERLIEPFAERIDGARRLRILPYGDLRGVDFHALPFRGHPLLAAKPVVYGLDLPPAEPGAPGPGGRRALVLADPTETLLRAPAEASAVARRLERRGWRVRRLPRAAGDDLRGALRGAELFHFAGHADFSGRGGWGSDLRLAEGTRLTLGDVLTSDSVPRTVVLSACEGGRGPAEGAVEGLGLAQAFLLAGAAEVVGAVEPVDDRTASALMAALYRHFDGSAPVAEALRLAQLELRRGGRSAEWARFRVLER